MQFVFEFLFHAVVEVFLYGTGRLFAALFLPRISIEPLDRQKVMPAWRYRAFTYRRGKHRYLYTETVQGIGLLVWLAIVALAWFVFALLQH